MTIEDIFAILFYVSFLIVFYLFLRKRLSEPFFLTPQEATQQLQSEQTFQSNYQENYRSYYAQRQMYTPTGEKQYYYYHPDYYYGQYQTSGY